MFKQQYKKWLKLRTCQKTMSETFLQNLTNLYIYKGLEVTDISFWLFRTKFFIYMALTSYGHFLPLYTDMSETLKIDKYTYIHTYILPHSPI